MAAPTIASFESATPIPSFGGSIPDTPVSFSRTGVQVIRRNGTFSPFDASKISVAITKAFIAVEGTNAAASRRIREAVEALTTQIVELGHGHVFHAGGAVADRKKARAAIRVVAITSGLVFAAALAACLWNGRRNKERRDDA